MKNKIILFILVVFIVSIGFFRDSLFVNVNYQLSYLFNNSAVNYTKTNYSFLNNFSYNQLYYGKWGLTILFSMIYYLLSIGILLSCFKNNKAIKWTTIVYGVLFMVSTISYLLGMLTNSPEVGYKFSRIFMGLLQSPLILMFLFPLFALDAKKNSNS